MASDERPLTGGEAGSTLVALAPAGAPEHVGGDWNSVPALTQPAAQAMPNLMMYLHALRRRWLMALGIGLVCASAAAVGVWLMVGLQYTASSFLRVAMQEDVILSRNDFGGTDQQRFEIYKGTQTQLITSRFVLIAALRKPEVAKLPVIRRQQEIGDPSAWLANRVGVGFPGRAEVMEVSISRDDASEATILVNAVVRAYLDEVVNAERDKKRLRLSELDRVYVERETEMRSKREDIRKLAEQLGTGENDILTLKQRLALEELTTLRNGLAQLDLEVRKLTAELEAQKAIFKSVGSIDVADAEVELMARDDPIIRQLAQELGWKHMDQRYVKGAVVDSAQSRYVGRFEQQLKAMEDEYTGMKEKLAEMVRQRKRSMIQMEITRLVTTLAVMDGTRKTAMSEMDEKKKEAENFGRTSVDIEMMRADIKNAELMLAGVASERDKLRVEVRSPARVTLLQKAEKPEMASNGVWRLVLVNMAGLAGLAFPAVVIAVWGARAQRINNCADVSKGLRLPVLGAVPLIPASVIRHLGSSSKRNQTWHVRLTESVDGIAARVLRKAETEQCRVIMVSSAAGGEGKTTLATQLALSLARAARRTVLVDFDLRRPSFDEVFGLPLQPGVCEVLRHEDAISSVVHQVPVDNLAIVTAGRWDRNALASLSNGSAAAMFKKLREDFDFVVIDSSPILPVADARFVSQHVDSVVLSVFRDISEAPKIQAACEILSAFGVQSVEAVVTGPTDNMYGRHMGYQSTISA